MRNPSKPTKTANKNGRNAQTRNRPQNGSVIYRLPPGTLIVPDRFHTHLKYYKSIVPVFVGNTVAARFQPSAAFDIDPLLGGTFPPGFAELSTLYASYRVRRSVITVDVAAGNATPFRTIVVPLNADPGAAPAGGTIIAWDQNPYARSMLVSAAGSPTVRINNAITTEKIFGSNMVHTDDNFAALVTTIPVNNWYWAVGFYTAFATVAAGPMTDVNIVIDIEFYDRKVST